MSAERPDPGQGVFETLLLSDGRVHALDAHLARLQRSVAELYGTSLTPQARAQLITRLTEAAADTPGERRARIDAVPDNGRLQLSIAVSDAPDRRPVTLGPVVVPGGLGAHKWRDRRLVERIPGGAVPLIIDGDGSVLEAAWANIWLLDGDRLTTPPADGRLLPGVTRARLLALAPALGLQARQEPIALERARASTGLFLTSALRLAVPAALGPAPAEAPPPAVDRIRAALVAG